MSDVAEPDRLSAVEPSPQSTLILVTVPSLSEQLKLRVTCWLVVAGLGDTPLILQAGGASVTVRSNLPMLTS